MLRMLLSTVAVLLLGVFAYLFFTDYFRTPQTTKAGDMLSNAMPPMAPIQSPPPPMQPVVAPVAPVAPVVQVQPPAAPVVPVPAPIVQQEPHKTHIVQRGDTLSSIARDEYGNEALFLKIAQANGLKNRDRIRIGQVLIIPEVSADTIEHYSKQPDNASTTLGPDFEPIPPTLSTTAPKK